MIHTSPCQSYIFQQSDVNLETPSIKEKFIVYILKMIEDQGVMRYLDPGNGYVITSQFSALIGIISTFFLSMMFFFRKKIKSFFSKKILLVLALALIIIGTAVIILLMLPKSSKVSKRVVIIGFDGMDPNVLEAGFKKGLFPNLKKLSVTGYYSKLQTVTPPQSPVVWASFATGSNPSKTGIYDFIKRDPQNYSLNLAFSVDNQTIKSQSFWDVATKNKIPSTILFLPDTFSPPKTLNGELISGMGVSDILGTEGTFTLFTTKTYPTDSFKWRGKVIPVGNNSTIKTNIEGPKFSSFGKVKNAVIPITINPAKDSAVIHVANQTFTLKKGEFSNWIKLQFDIDFLTKVSGIAKFYLKESGDDLELYLSPINFDPEAPFKPISAPKDFSQKLSKQFGSFSTLGLPQDTWALEEDIFDEKAFLTQADSILKEREKIYYSKLNSSQKGILFAYFGMPDTISHMFWRYLNDPQSPYQNTIFDYYGKMDEIVGQTMEKLGPEDYLFILSDHGFYSFDYELNLNTFLKEKGYLVLKEGANQSGQLFENVDWSKTTAYSAGYNSIFLNLKAREGQGIVDKSDTSKIEEKLTADLMDLENPETGQKVIKKVYNRRDLDINESDNNAPDLIIGPYRGTRASWHSAVGSTGDKVLAKRESKWSGDHFFDPSEIPGVLFVNKKEDWKNPSIVDVMPTVLQIFNVSFDNQIEGKDLTTQQTSPEENEELENLKSLGY